MDCSLPGSSVHGVFQARLLEWVAISFSIVHSLGGTPFGEARMRFTPECLELGVSAQRPGLAFGLELHRIEEISSMLVFPWLLGLLSSICKSAFLKVGSW